MASDDLSCPKCLKKFASIKKLKRHQQIVHVARRFTCKICEKSFKYQSNLSEHSSIHTGTMLHHCQFCDKSCRLKGNLKKHIARHHKGEIDKSANKSDDSLSSDGEYGETLGVLNNINNTHNFNMEWIQNSHLSNFLTTTTREAAQEKDENPQKKPDSECVSLSNQSMDQYQESSMVLDNCLDLPKATEVSVSSENVIGGKFNKEYHCETCGKVFRSRSNRNEHHGTHSPSKPFACKICGTASRLKGNIKQHIKKHHKKTATNDDIIVQKNIDCSGSISSSTNNVSKRPQVSESAHEESTFESMLSSCFTLPSTTTKAVKIPAEVVGSSVPQRFIYISLGVNYGDSIDLRENGEISSLLDNDRNIHKPVRANGLL